VLATLSTVTTAEVNTQADLALSDIGLDHLIAVADGDDPVNGSIIAEMTSATEDWSTFSAANNSLEALRTRGDNAWITGAGSDSVTTLRWVNLAVWGLTMDPDSSATADRNVNVRFWDDAEITDGNSWPDVDIADVVSGVIDADAIGADAIGTSEWDNAVTNAINNLIWGDTSGAGVRGQLFLETYRNAENINYRADDEYSADHNYFNHPYVMDPGDLWNDFEAVGDWTLVSNSDSTVVAEETTNVKEGSKSVRLTSKNEYPASAMWTLPNPHIYYFNNCGIQYYVDPEYTPYFTDYPCSTSLEYVRIKFLTGDSVITDNDTTHYFEQEWLSFNVASGWNSFQWCRDSMVASDAVASWDSTLMAIKIEVNSKTDAGASYGTEWASVCFDNLRMDIVSKTIAQLRIDDGYKDVFDNAYLPLKARGIQGICMIPTQSVDELVEDIDLDDMRVMAADGWQFATHAHSSRAFGFVSGLDGDDPSRCAGADTAQRREMYTSYAWMNEYFETTIGSYPKFEMDSIALRLYKERYEMCYGGRLGYWSQHRDPVALAGQDEMYITASQSFHTDSGGVGWMLNDVMSADAAGVPIVLQFHRISASGGTHAGNVCDLDSLLWLVDTCIAMGIPFLTPAQYNAPYYDARRRTYAGTDSTRKVLDSIYTYDATLHAVIQEILDTLKTYDDGSKLHAKIQTLIDGVDVVTIEDGDATDQLDTYGTDAAELTADVDTNTFDITAQLAGDVDTNTFDITAQLAGDVDTNTFDITAQLAGDVDTNLNPFQNNTDQVLLAADQEVDVTKIDGVAAAATNLEKLLDGDSATFASRITARQLLVYALDANTGIYVQGGSTGGHAIFADAQGGDANGFYLKGSGTGHGISTIGGGTNGNGMFLDGGVTNGHGLSLRGKGTGDGLNATVTGSGSDINATLDLDDTAGDLDSADFANDLYTGITNFLFDADTSNAAWNGDDTKFGYWGAGRQLGSGGSGDFTAEEADSIVQIITIALRNQLANDSLKTLMDVADAIQTKTDNLPPDPADDGDIDGQLATIQADLDSPAQYQSDGDTNTTTGITYGTGQALVFYKLDHLIAVADGDDPVDNSVIAKMAASDGVWSGFDKTTDALEAIADGGGSSNWTDAQRDSVLNTIEDANKPNYMADVSGCATGEGSKTLRVYAVDTANDAHISGVMVTMKAVDGASNLAVQATNPTGYFDFTSNASTTYPFKGLLTGYTFPDGQTITTDAGAGSYTDSIMGYPIVVGAPGNAALKRVYDYVYTGDADTLGCQGLTFTATLIAPDSGFAAYDSATSVVILNPKRTYTNSSCYIFFDLYPNEGTSNAIIPHGSSWEIKGMRGGEVIYQANVVLTGTATERISALQQAQADR
jgi:hypothetical protein